MDSDDKIIGSIFIAIILVGLLAAVWHFARPLNLAGDPVHELVAYGHNWTVSAPWGASGYQCYVRGQGFAQAQHNDVSNASRIRLEATLPNHGSQDCGEYSMRFSVRLDSLNLQDVQSAKISRAVHVEAGAEDGGSYFGNLSGITSAGRIADDSSLTFKRDLGDVFITNDGTSITINTKEGREVYDARQPLFFEDFISMSANDPSGGLLTYEITGLEVKYRNTPAPAAQPADPSPAIPPVLEAPAAAAQSWWDRLLAYIKGVFS